MAATSSSRAVRSANYIWVVISRYLLLSVFAVIFAFPILYMIMSSLKPSAQMLADSSSIRAFLPVGSLSLDNYTAAFSRVPIVQFMTNSIFVSTVTVLGGLLINSLAGFSLACIKWKGKDIVFAAIIATLIVPFETIAVPLLLIVSKLPWVGVDGITTGWLNTYHVQIIPFLANAFSIFLFVQYFKDLPQELIEAARIDGASWWQIFTRVYMPLAGPIIATVAILTFLPKWNDYMWPIMVIQKEEFRPIMVGLQYFFQLNIAWAEIMAYLTAITLPVLLLFLALQRKFIESIATTGIK